MKAPPIDIGAKQQFKRIRRHAGGQIDHDFRGVS
jgi:hypothetical protein